MTIKKASIENGEELYQPYGEVETKIKFHEEISFIWGDYTYVGVPYSRTDYYEDESRLTVYGIDLDKVQFSHLLKQLEGQEA